jgi:hypothetical protein
MSRRQGLAWQNDMSQRQERAWQNRGNSYVRSGKIVKKQKQNNSTTPAQYVCPILTSAEECDEQKHDWYVAMAAEEREMVEQEQAEKREMQRELEEQKQAEKREMQRELEEQKRVNRHYAWYTLKGRQNAYYRQELEDELYDFQKKLREQVYLN